jgi:hypothetical protein
VKTIDVNKDLLVKAMKQCFRFDTKFTSTVKYLFGAKPKLGSIPGIAFNRADCSGFVRWLIDSATEHKNIMPDGSWNQWQWCKQQGFKETSYLNCGLKDNRLRIAFMRAKDGEAGHVWLIVNGLTIESYGGHGTGRRKWNTSILLREVDACYVLTEPLG